MKGQQQSKNIDFSDYSKNAAASETLSKFWESQKRLIKTMNSQRVHKLAR